MPVILQHFWVTQLSVTFAHSSGGGTTTIWLSWTAPLAAALAGVFPERVPVATTASTTTPATAAATAAVTHRWRWGGCIATPSESSLRGVMALDMPGEKMSKSS